MQQEYISVENTSKEQEAEKVVASAKDDTAENLKNDFPQQIEALKAQCAVLQDKYIRAKADLENTRKRFVKEREDVRFQTLQFVCMPIVALFDSFKLGLTSAEQSKISPEVLKGFQMIFQQFQMQLKLLGIEEIFPENQVFDPHFHEAVSKVHSETVPEDHIIQVVRSGYKMDGKLLRAASVVVSQGKAPQK